MEKLAPLLEKLAKELGTTTEYLWRVLLKQASIAFAGYCVTIGVFIIFTILLYYLVRWSFQSVEKEDKYESTKKKTFNTRWSLWNYEYGDGVIGIGLLSIIPLVPWIIGLTYILTSIPLIIASLINPEYWALHKVLSFITR